MKNISLKQFIMIAIAMAILCGVVYSLPDVKFIMDARDRYKGIGPIGFTDETVYLGRMNAIYKGNINLRNPAIYEHRNDPVIMPSLPEFVEASIGRFLGLSIAQVDILATFLLPALLFFIIAMFAHDLSGTPFGALTAASAILFGMHFFSKLFIFSGKIFNPAYDLPLWFARPITPQMHFVFFVSSLYFIYKGFAENRPLCSIIGGIFLGALFYVSVFYWVYIFAVIGCLFLILLYERDVDAIRNIVIVSVLALPISAPYWFENFKTMHDHYYGLLLLRFNIGFTHRMILPVGAIIVLALVLISRRIITQGPGRKTFFFLNSMLTAIILTLNQQILTGKLFKESHWTTYTGKFAVILCTILTISLILRYLFTSRPGLKWFLRTITIGFFLSLLAHGIVMQMNYYYRHFSMNLNMQNMAGALKWLKDHATPDAVILPSPNESRLSELVPIYTNSYVYYSEPFFCMSLIPAEETRYRMLATYRLFEFTPEQAKKYPYSWDGAIFLTSATNRPASFIEEEKAKLYKEYLVMLDKDALGLAKKYKMDYLLVVNKTDSLVMDRLVKLGLERVYDDGHYSILQVGGANG